MPRNLDPTLAGALSAGLIQPAVLVQLTLNSGVERVWSGIGDLIWNGNTFTGVGHLGSVGPIREDSAVKADGTTVTLSGIGLSQIPVPGPPVTPPSPPFTPPAGQSVAWSLATIPPAPSAFANGPAFFNSGSASGTRTTGTLGTVGGAPDPHPNSVGLTWSGFKMPPEIPPGAKITGVYPIAVVSAIGADGGGIISSSLPQNFGGSGTGTDTGLDLGTLEGAILSAEVANSLDGGSLVLGMTISFIGLAVYYEGEPLSKTTLLYEALQDIRMGAPAKIWYSLRSNGTFLGTPYLIFSGTVDKPTIKASAESLSITIALENRLRNLQRPNARRYTAADQKLYYPTDSAFNWVEILNDMALIWG